MVDTTTCASPQIFQFRAVVWGPGTNDIGELPLVQGDNSSAATAINDAGQVVGISGTCDQAIGRATATHAVLWNRGQITEIPNIGGDTWNTPMAINQRGDIVGFLGQAGDDPDNPRLRAFLWTRERGTQNLGTIPGDDYSEARGINERRQVVGVSCVDPSLVSCRAFLWENGVMSDLNDLAPTTPGGAVLINGQDINDSGVITGRAFIAGPPALRYAFVAIPGPRLAVNDVGNSSDAVRGRKRVTLPPDVALEMRSPMGPLPGSRMSNPDVFVVYHVAFDKQKDISTYSSGYGGGYGPYFRGPLAALLPLISPSPALVGRAPGPSRYIVCDGNAISAPARATTSVMPNSSDSCNSRK